MDYKVSSTDLTNIADAINAKTGTNTQLEFPDAFVDAIESLGGNTIVFYVDMGSNAVMSLESFVAEPMTWREFIDSKYNPYCNSSTRRFYLQENPGPMGIDYAVYVRYARKNNSNFYTHYIIGNPDATIVDGQTY